MALDKYIEQTFPIKCMGRDNNGQKVLDVPVDVKVIISQHQGDDKKISSLVDCQYNTGAHGKLCGALTFFERTNYGIRCPYSFEISL